MSKERWATVAMLTMAALAIVCAILVPPDEKVSKRGSPDMIYLTGGA